MYWVPSLRVYGLTQPQFNQIRAVSLAKSSVDPMQLYQLTVEPARSHDIPFFGFDAPDHIINALHSLLHEFQDLVIASRSLPPVRDLEPTTIEFLYYHAPNCQCTAIPIPVLSKI